MVRRQRRKCHGFTLIELLVSCLILALGLVAMSQLFISAVYAYHTSRNNSIATQRAQREYEYVGNIGFYALRGCSPTSNPYNYDSSYALNTNNNGVTFPVLELTGGHGDVTWEAYPSGTTMSAAHMLKVTIHIAWRGRSTADSSVKVVSYVVEDPSKSNLSF